MVDDLGLTRDLRAVGAWQSPVETAQLICTGTSGTSSGDEWPHLASWLTKFRDFILAKAGRPLSKTELRAHTQKNENALDFIAALHGENRGRTRAAAAGRAVEFFHSMIKALEFFFRLSKTTHEPHSSSGPPFVWYHTYLMEPTNSPR